MSHDPEAPSPVPWNYWIPGVLSKTQVRNLIESGIIEKGDQGRLDNSSLDLTLSDEGYEMVRGSVKPSGAGYLDGLKSQALVRDLEPDADGSFQLHMRKTYLFRLQESIGKLGESDIFGQATAKSSVGRVDVLARLIVDGMDVYESFNPSSLDGGEMYVELTPMTFNVVVKLGVPLVQLRFFQGRPEDCEMRGRELYKSVLRNTTKSDGSLSVDLSSIRKAELRGCAFRAKRDTASPPIRLWVDNSQPKANPGEYWKVEKPDENNRLTIEKDHFYIMRSRERIRLPAGIAVYCRATDETIGEMRIHYAGFVHPFFGYEAGNDGDGTPLIFEVRGHDVDVTLGDGEKMANLVFYRMSEDCLEHENKPSNYNEQTLSLSKFFAEWQSGKTNALG